MTIKPGLYEDDGVLYAVWPSELFEIFNEMVAKRPDHEYRAEIVESLGTWIKQQP